MDAPKPLELPKPLAETIEELQLWASYGLFMAVWQAFDEVLEFIIHREARLTRVHAVIIVSGLGFERKASIARSLLALKGDKYKPAISLINRITAAGERNTLTHGQLTIKREARTLRFVKRQTDQRLTLKPVTFGYPDISARNKRVLAMLAELKDELGMTKAEGDAWDKMTERLLSKLGTSPAPPSS